MMADPSGQVAIAVASVLGRFGVRLAYATDFCYCGRTRC